MLLIQFSHLFKSFRSHILFEDISLGINQGERLTLIGENGAGKTTLLQLLTGSLKPDSGTIHKKAGLSIGFLPQEIVFATPSNSVRTYLEGQLSILEKELTACLEDSTRLTQWAELHEIYERLGGYRRVPLEKVLEGLKLERSLLDEPLSLLSGGQKVRVALAKVLMENPDLLLLDEPTNHLDEEMLKWLEETLKKRTGATLIVSHDRQFLNAVCNRLVAIKNGKLFCFGGNYDFYLVEQENLLKRQMKAFEAQEEERALLKQKIKAMTFSKARASPPSDTNIIGSYDKRGERHQKSQQRSLVILKARLAEIEAAPLLHPKPKSIKGLKFIPTFMTSRVVIELDHICKAYGQKILFSECCRNICKGERILVTGPNGAGKTTLLRCLAGLVSLDKGSIKFARGAKIAYLDQEVALLPREQTPLVYFENRFSLSEEELRRQLHQAALGGEDLLKRSFSTLSTGQRKRLMLLSLILEKPNILLVDEPTNHLDFMTLEAFEKALLDFDGALVAVSHDATFIKKVATQKWKL